MHLYSGASHCYSDFASDCLMAAALSRASLTFSARKYFLFFPSYSKMAIDDMTATIHFFATAKMTSLDHNYNCHRPCNRYSATFDSPHLDLSEFDALLGMIPGHPYLLGLHRLILVSIFEH